MALLAEEYARQGFDRIDATFRAATTLLEKVDIYLFHVTLLDNPRLALMGEGEEYAGIIISNGNFMRLEKMENGDYSVFTGQEASKYYTPAKLTKNSIPLILATICSSVMLCV
ncbi:MAG: hypothetical protein FWG10_13060 [Eubacteriaceae bacterium]|nr:hypothetical protein [Eubacteriaceae bacterium]